MIDRQRNYRAHLVTAHVVQLYPPTSGQAPGPSHDDRL